mmetsp:Transcript_38914/g.66763  ORF Transcript_38914/g.66763 Transcript_38914/m.66763 type:complete len:94 (+) Transcript_38914:35-316(+)
MSFSRASFRISSRVTFQRFKRPVWAGSTTFQNVNDSTFETNYFSAPTNTNSTRSYSTMAKNVTSLDSNIPTNTKRYDIVDSALVNCCTDEDGT